MRFISKSTAETKRIAADLARHIVKSRRKQAAIIALEGELGTGKTTFVQGFAKALGIRHNLRSPTFLIMREYPVSTGILFHIDCYRINSIRDIEPLEIKHIFANQRHIVLIEWAERIRRVIPRGATWIRFYHVSPRERRITITT